MIPLAYKFLPVFFLIALGAVLGKKGFFSVEMVDGMKKTVTSIALPAVLFAAFSRVNVDTKLLLLAVGIYVACATMGLIGRLVARMLRLPSPATQFLFQGFEAGMLGYGLFLALFGQSSVSFFATADLGQVVFVFSALMTQLKRAEIGAAIPARALLKNMLLSPVIIAIVAGLLASAFFPGARGTPWADDGALSPLLGTLGALTSPLVCLVVGFGLKDYQLRGAGQALTLVFVRMGTALAVGAVIAFALVRALGFPMLQSVAVIFLFILPPPFVIPVFRTAKADAAYISSVLSLHTVVSIAATAILAALLD